jgi:hypothetical protein
MQFVLNLQDLSPAGDVQFDDGLAGSATSLLICSNCCSSISLIC